MYRHLRNKEDIIASIRAGEYSSIDEAIEELANFFASFGEFDDEGVDFWEEAQNALKQAGFRTLNYNSAEDRTGLTVTAQPGGPAVSGRPATAQPGGRAVSGGSVTAQPGGRAVTDERELLRLPGFQEALDYEYPPSYYAQLANTPSTSGAIPPQERMSPSASAQDTSGAISPISEDNMGLREEELGGLPMFLQRLKTAGIPQTGSYGDWARGRFSDALGAFYGAQAASGGGRDYTKGSGEREFSEGPFAAFLAKIQGKDELAGLPDGSYQAAPLWGPKGHRTGSEQEGRPFLGLGAGLGSAANKTFSELVNSLQDRQAMTGYQEAYATPSSEQEFGWGGNLARIAATGRLGGLAASRFLPSTTKMYQRFLGSEEGKDASNWLPFLQRYLDL